MAAFFASRNLQCMCQDGESRRDPELKDLPIFTNKTNYRAAQVKSADYEFNEKYSPIRLTVVLACGNKEKTIVFDEEILKRQFRIFSGMWLVEENDGSLRVYSEESFLATFIPC